MKKNMVSWFEIPVSDMNRAKAFYDNVFGVSIMIQDFGGTLMGWFPYEADKLGISGSLIKNKAYTPSESIGALVYFNTEDIDDSLKKVKANGGTLLQDKTQISPEIGHMALFIDSEGNRIAFYTSANG